jgi:hypothetical protein
VVPGTVLVTVVNRTKWHVDETMVSLMVREHCDSELSALPVSSLSVWVAPHDAVRLELPACTPGGEVHFAWIGLELRAHGLTW